MNAGQRTVPAYDDQAATYDGRAGIPDAACGEIARAVRAIAGILPADLIVDVGAGTGLLGGALADPPACYVGFDLSAAMLGKFRPRLEHGACDALLVQADGNAGWPIRTGAARLVFGSRAIHLLDAERVVSEVFRLAAPEGATFLIGRVQREPAGLKARMRGEMRRRLAQRGVAGRDTGSSRERILAACRVRGATSVEAVMLARWHVTTSPRQSLDSWQAKDGLAGARPPAALKLDVLDEMAEWAAATFGDLDGARESVESYVVEGVRIMPASRLEADR